MNYILTHTLVYGIIGGVFVYYLGYCKLLHVGIGAFFVGLAFVVQSFLQDSVVVGIALGLFLFLFFTFLQWVMMHYFPHQSQRDVFSVMFTLGAAIFVQNLLGFIFGASSISLSFSAFSSPVLVVFITLCTILIWYLFQKSITGKIFIASRESHNTVKSLGISLHRFLLFGAWGWLVMLLFAAGITLGTGGIRAADGLFYLIIGIGIMVASGSRGITGVFLISGAYACLEYLLFVTMDVPLAYKAALMITLILVLLMIKPEGVFSFRRRTL